MREQVLAFLVMLTYEIPYPRAPHCLKLDGENLVLRLRVRDGVRLICLADGNIEHPREFLEDIRRFGSLRPNGNGTGFVRARLIELLQTLNRELPPPDGFHCIDAERKNNGTPWELCIRLRLPWSMRLIKSDGDFGFVIRPGELETSARLMVNEMHQHLKVERAAAIQRMEQVG